MAAPTKNFTVIADSAIDADSPLTEDLMTDLRDNDIHLQEWLGGSFTAAIDHDHNGVNSAFVADQGGIAKASNEVMNNDDTLQDDNSLFFPVVADSTYIWNMVLYIVTSASADFQFDIILPAASTGHYQWEAQGPVGTITGSVLQEIPGTPSDLLGATNNYTLKASGVVVIDSTPGTFQLQWAQLVATVVNTSVFTNSFLSYKKIA